MAIGKFTIVFQGDILDIYKCYQQLQKEKTDIVFSPADQKTRSSFLKLDRLTEVAIPRITKKPKQGLPVRNINSKRPKTMQPAGLLCEIGYGDYRKYKSYFTEIIRYKSANVTNADNTITYRGKLYCDPTNLNKAKKLVGIVLRQHPKLKVNWLQ